MNLSHIHEPEAADMLAVNTYPKAYIAECRAKALAYLETYVRLKTTAGAPEVAAFEPECLRHMVLAVDNYFTHRARALELKDGNPINEVRMICASILNHNGRLAPDKTIKYKPETSVLKLKLGDEITLTTESTAALLTAFFNEMDVKFGA